MKDSLQQTQW